MDRSYFMAEDALQELSKGFAVKNGWMKIYEQSGTSEDSSMIYCYLVHNSHLEAESTSHSWTIRPGSEGKPSVYGDNTYKTYDDDGLEPFIFSKSFRFQDGSARYVDISEELVLYFKLYEEGADKNNRKFYYVNDYGVKDEVLIVKEKQILIKMKYLREYITMRDMSLAVCYETMRLLKTIPDNWDLPFGDKKVSENNVVYSHLIRHTGDRFQSWLLGKMFIRPNEVKKTHYDAESTNLDFIVGYDSEGDLRYESCATTQENIFQLTFFDKKVLHKYYSDPERYQVDGFSVSNRFFRLKIDNNVEEYVPVFLNELRMLPFDEQLHWKQYNIPQAEGMSMSHTYYTTMIEGNWAESNQAVDLFFKDKYRSFNEKWLAHFGWSLYKPLAAQDEHFLNALHLIPSNNVKGFCEQTLTMVKLTIDRLNEKEFSKFIEVVQGDKGLTKFQKYLASCGMEIPDMFEFLRNLQSLRSGLIAHTFSDSNKDCKKAMEYFGIDGTNYVAVSKDIFVKSIFTLNTLENYFNLTKDK